MTFKTLSYPQRAVVDANFADRLVVLAPEAHFAYGLASAISSLRVLTWKGAQGCAKLRQLGVDLVAIPMDAEGRSTKQLVSHPRATQALTEWGPSPVLVFRPDVTTQKALAAVGSNMLSAAPNVARRLENKRVFRELARSGGLPVVETRELKWPPTADGLSGMSGPKVVQTARGFAGKRTWMWRDEMPSLPMKLHGRPTLIAPFLPGPTWTVNAVVTPHRFVRVGAPMLQISADPRLSPRPAASAGATFVDSEHLSGRAICALAKQVGELAFDLGFVGFFGIDAVGLGADLTLIEMNARLTATVTVATLAELAAGHLPLAVSHVLACAGEDDCAPSELRGVDGGHLIIRDTGREVRRLETGTYRLPTQNCRELTRLRADVRWPASHEVAAWSAGPSEGGPEGDLLRLQWSRPMVDNNNALTASVEGVLERLFESALLM